ncbi:transposase [Streptomyces sp. NPDC088747]|uniref:transposase n=1 Tax=Streptomyces sp. NPDC088747 TaxID=3365886 RepID=UPI0037FD06E9
MPPVRVRPRGGGVANIDDEAVFAVIIYVLVTGCAWRALPPWFGASKSTVRRPSFSVACWGLGSAAPEGSQFTDDRDLIDLSRAVLESAHVRSGNGSECF